MNLYNYHKNKECLDLFNSCIYGKNNQSTFFLLKGYFHRNNNLPAVIYSNDYQVEYWVNGHLHREDGPAKIGNILIEYWVNGEKHRKNGKPAIQWRDGHEEYWVNGQLHRESGPAVIYSNGKTEYWINGKQIISY